MKNSILIHSLNISPSSIEYNVSLKTKTWIHRGGIASVYFTPKNTDELICIGKYLFDQNNSFDIYGHASNMYFHNTYNPEFVIDTRNVKEITITDEHIICGCGYPMAQLSRTCISMGIQGYEGFINIPGTVAGACTNNSGCYGSLTANILHKVEVLTPQNEIRSFYTSELGYSERSSALKRKEIEGIIIKCYFKKNKTESIQMLEARAKENTRLRRLQHEPPKNNLGSVYVHSFRWKKNLRNCIILGINFFLRCLNIQELTRKKTLKIMLLLLYNKLELKQYISDKSIQCFLWKDEKADLHFDSFIELFNDFANSPIMEIEQKK